MSEGRLALLAAIQKIQAELKPMRKNGTNPHFKSRYTTLDEIWEAVKSPIHQNGLVVYCTIERDGALVTHLADIKTGEEMTSSFPIPTNGTPQVIGSAITYARRYTLCALLEIVANDEDDDGELASRPAAKPATAKIDF